MKLSFHDELTSKVDAKGRVSIPAAHRAVFAAGDPDCVDGKNPIIKLIHSFSHEHCLRAFTVEAYAEIQATIEDMDAGPERDQASKKLIHKASTIQIDDNGRIILRKDIRERFDIGASAVFVGSTNHMQIWDQTIYQADDDDEKINPFMLLNSARRKAKSGAENGND